MGQFLPEVEDIFEEIRNYKVRLEERVNNSVNPNSIKYQTKTDYSLKK